MTSNYYPTPPQYGAPQYGTPPPAYGAPAPGGSGPGRRPGTVIAAAVLAFGYGGLVSCWCFLGLIILAAQTFAWHAVARYGAGQVGVVWVIELSTLVLGALLLWGAVAALTGRTRRILVVVSVLQAIVCLAGMVVGLAGIGIMDPDRGAENGWFMRGVFGLIFVAPTLILILRWSSRDFFRARSGKTTA